MAQRPYSEPSRFYTKKHLVRDCYCEEFTDRAYLLNKNGKDGEGYEIHKTRGEVLHCKWRKYRMGRKKWALVRKCTCGRYTEGEVNGQEVAEESQHTTADKQKDVKTNESSHHRKKTCTRNMGNAESNETSPRDYTDSKPRTKTYNPPHQPYNETSRRGKLLEDTLDLYNPTSYNDERQPCLPRVPSQFSPNNTTTAPPTTTCECATGVWRHHRHLSFSRVTFHGSTLDTTDSFCRPGSSIN
ncbi:hypothetical protein Bbelb_171840 [Branchiostoma belcheri]|nr:hypothetical protein Bbelb_171840 [Branchiostoma belcheri]